ncbi:MAG: hypothetical protein ACRECT_05060 [Thermoplasmata archaeon]
MLIRTLLTLANFGTIAVAILVLLTYPQYASIAFYVLLGWMFASLALMYSPWASRRVRTSATAPGPSISGDAPLASTAHAQHASSVGFCIYCAAPVAPGTARCPACGRTLPHFA